MSHGLLNQSTEARAEVGWVDTCRTKWAPALRPELRPPLSATAASPTDGVVTPVGAEVGTRRPTVTQATCSLHQGGKGQHACHSFPTRQARREAC